MGEIHSNVRTYQVDYACDKCNNGFLVAGNILLSNPPQWEHNCTNSECDNKQNFHVKYPSIQYQQIEIPEEDEQFELIKVDGYVDKADGGMLGEAEFWHAFIDFVESHGWQFGGVIKGVTDEEAEKEVGGDD